MPQALSHTATPLSPARLWHATQALLRPSPAWAYTLRVLLAIAVAMYSAYWLELDSPYSAGTTVLVVMNASRGAIVSKSVWRVCGSIVGAIAAVVIVALFVQTPVLFIFAIAAWIGLCTAIGSLLRYNRSYAAVLAGYTVTLVAFGAISDPDRIFELATSRVAVVTIGVLSTAVVFLVTDPGPKRAALENRVAALITSASKLILAALRTGDLAAAIRARHDLAAQLSALDQVVEFASVEDAGLGRYAGDLRFAVAELFAALTGGLHAVTLLRREAELHGDTAPGQALDDILTQLASIAPGERAATLHRAAEARIAELRARAQTTRNAATLAALDQAILLLEQLSSALASLGALQDGRPRRPPVRLRNYVNPVTAWRNGLRAGIAVSLGGLFWIISQWPDGGSTLALIGPVCALLSQSDSAAQGSVDFMKGTMIAVVAGFICCYAILPQITGFPLLMAAMLPFIAAGVLLSRNPKYGIVGLGSLVFFVTLVGPNNPMRFSLAASLNTYVAFVIGAACAVLAFRVILPPNPRAEARVLEHSLRNAVQRQARRWVLPPVLVWEHLQHQKLVRLARRLAADPTRRGDAISQGALAVVAGRHIATLRAYAADATMPAAVRAAAQRSIAGFRHLLANPAAASATAEREAAALMQGSDLSRPCLRLAATLHDLAEVVGENQDFFARNQGGPR